MNRLSDTGAGKGEVALYLNIKMFSTVGITIHGKENVDVLEHIHYHLWFLVFPDRSVLRTTSPLSTSGNSRLLVLIIAAFAN